MEASFVVGETGKSLAKVRKMIERDERKIEQLDGEWRFPVKVGARERGNGGGYSNRILVFVNFLMHALRMDENIGEELVQVKRSCLKLLRVDDFSQEAEFRDPCFIMKVTDVVCKACLHVAELEVFRDSWACAECATPYDRCYLEHKLVELVRDSLTYY